MIAASPRRSPSLFGEPSRASTLFVDDHVVVFFAARRRVRSTDRPW
jgi:hypothetical protein